MKNIFAKVETTRIITKPKAKFNAHLYLLRVSNTTPFIKRYKIGNPMVKKYGRILPVEHRIYCGKGGHLKGIPVLLSAIAEVRQFMILNPVRRKIPVKITTGDTKNHNV